jgi:hypothetical protein
MEYVLCKMSGGVISLNSLKPGFADFDLQTDFGGFWEERNFVDLGGFDFHLSAFES